MSNAMLSTVSNKRLVTTVAAIESDGISASQYLDLIQRDGILKTRNLSHAESAVTLRRNRKLIVENDSASTKQRDQKFDISKIQLTFNEASIWLLPVTSQKMAVQWHLPNGMRRNCLDIFKNEEACFVLRIYQNLETPSGWKKSQRTLEFEIDIERNCCYINLENNIGLYTAELGLRCSRDRHIFIARSAEIRMPNYGNVAMKHLEKSLRLTKQTWSKKHPLKHQVVKKYIDIDKEDEFNDRDLESEENTVALYRDFNDEGPRSLRIAETIKPISEEKRKEVLANRKIKTDVNRHGLSTPQKGKLVNTLNPNHSAQKYSINEFQVMAVSNKKEKVNHASDDQRIKSKFSIDSKEKSTFIDSKALREKISKLKDKAEIILRGKVKRIGQRVRVGGLLIEPEEDGSFCVACVIRNGKLYVPVEEVSAICEI